MQTSEVGDVIGMFVFVDWSKNFAQGTRRELKTFNELVVVIGKTIENPFLFLNDFLIGGFANFLKQ